MIGSSMSTRGQSTPRRSPRLRGQPPEFTVHSVTSASDTAIQISEIPFIRKQEQPSARRIMTWLLGIWTVSLLTGICFHQGTPAISSRNHEGLQ